MRNAAATRVLALLRFFFANRLITAFRYPGSQCSVRDEVLLGGKPAQIGSLLAQHNLHGFDANRIDLRHIHPAHSVQRLARGSWPRLRKLLILG